MQDNPVQKVLQLLTELEAKIIKDGEVEQKAYEDYADWCENGAKDKQFEIKTAKADIEDLKATITKAAADIEALEAKIGELASDIATDEADLKAATEIRDKEFAEFSAADAELVDALDTLDRAIMVLEKNMKGSALVQAQVDTSALKNVMNALNAVIEAASMNSHDKNTLLSLAQSDAGSDDDDMGAPDPAAYKSHSKNIVEVLEDMREKAEAQLSEGRKAEMNAKHNYDMLKQSLDDSIAANNAELSESKTGKATAQETKATAEGDLAGTEKALADAQKVLGSMHSDCMAKATEHEDSVNSRAEELKALAEAKKIISSMTAGAEAKTYSFLQVGSVRLGSINAHMQTRADLINFEVVTLVKKIGREQHSPQLTQLASRIASAMRIGAASGDDPFAKVKELISGMIERLLKEGEEEASHKAYCDEEMGKTKKKRMELAHDVEVLTGKIDKAKATSAKLKGEVAELQKELAELASSQAELDKIRAEEKEAFTETKADLEQGLEGVRMALKVLKDYYSASPELLQARAQQPAAPGTHEAASGASSGIIGMLEVIESDFSKNLAASMAEEEAAVTEYEKVTQENKITKTIKEQDVKYKTKEFTGLDKEISELSSDLEGVQSELDAVLAYTKTIRGQCELKPESYEERAKRREAEIAGLKEALAILEGEAVLLQKKLAKQHPGRGLRGSH